MNPAWPPSRKLPSALVTGLVALLLAAQWWLGVSAVRELGVTTDELVHVTGGFSYWKFNDYRLQPENGNLPQRLAALPWVLDGARMDTTGPDPQAWPESDVWHIGHAFFFGSGNNTDYLLLLSRALMALTGTALGLLIFAWSRSLWGDAGGLLSLALYAFCPNFLAHAPLATSDVTMTLCLLAASGAFWRQTRVLDGRSLAASVVLTALATVAKFSFGLLLPVFALMAVVRLASAEPLLVQFGGRRELRTWRGKLGALLASAAIHGVVAWIAIWACFGFRFSAVGPGMPAQTDFFWPWSVVLPAQGFWHDFLQLAHDWRLLPDAFLDGFGTVLHASAERGAFLNGEYSNTGWAWFFPYSFLVKTPLSQLAGFALAGIAAFAVWRNRREGRWARVRADLYRVTPLLALFAVYWVVSIRTHLNIGHRHILPTSPVRVIGAGLLWRAGGSRLFAALAVLLALGNAVESATVRPSYLAYFNSLAGGPENGWRHLVDSSLDWGQDLPRLAAWLRQEAQPGERVYVSYAGSDDFRYEGIRARELAFVYNFNQPREWYELEPGLYCISATALQNVYTGWRGTWTLEKERSMLAFRSMLAAAPAPQTFAERKLRADRLFALDQLRFVRLCNYLRVRGPDAMVGYSFLIFRLSGAEVHAAAYGTMNEFAAIMDQAIQAKTKGP
ncbi:MAG TPA: hypothetical protein VHD61_12690 [Lacunisphaera sp.]|nr:hypothetical protein [Lacunisphaera sp.]